MLRPVATLFLSLFIITDGIAQTKKLPAVAPQAAGFTPAFFPALTKKLQDSMPSLGSFIVCSRAGIVYENYFHGATDQTAFNIKSITKTMISALAGVARGKSLLPDLNTPMLRYFPEFAKPRARASTVWFANDKASEDSIRKTLTLKHLLTMQTGWEWSDFSGPVNIFVNSADPIRFMMDVPFAESPGTRFNYCSAATSVFSEALTRCIKTDIRKFADANLFNPLGITLTRWDTDPLGRYVGASEMYMTSQSLVRFGLLYLYNGKLGNKQLIPAAWVKESTDEKAKLDYWDILPGANGYGYYWWRRKSNGHQAWVASGAMGQIITVIPDLEMVVVANCFLDKNNRGREEIRRIHLFIDEITKQLN